MFLHPKNYNLSNEILYALHSADRENLEFVSKIGLQKVIYLSNVLAPVKTIVLETIKFLSYIRGPYSKDVQNIVDQLVAIGLVKIINFEKTIGRNVISHYQITDGGKQVVDNLIKYHKEDEKLWWLSTIVKVSVLYSDEEVLKDDTSFNGLDSIVKLVYEEPTFLELRTFENDHSIRHKSLIELHGKSAPTNKLIAFTLHYIKNNNLTLRNERMTAELVILAFFEFLYSKYLSNNEE